MQFETNRNFLHAGKSGGGKAKNKSSSSGKAQDGAAKAGYHIPRLNPLFEMDSEDEDLGQEIPLCNDSLKFRSIPNKSIKDVLTELKSLLNEDLITNEEYEQKRKEILKRI